MWTVRIVRTDGTTVDYSHVKHVMKRCGGVELILGEHGVDRKYVYYPPSRIDHVIVAEGKSGGD